MFIDRLKSLHAPSVQLSPQALSFSLDASTSAYLNVVRFGAAVVVVLDHFAQAQFSGGLLWQFHSLGAAAVDVFFVLSGFVISLVCCKPAASGLTYTSDRAARILSVAVPALIATFLLDSIGSWLSPGTYSWHDFDKSGFPLQGLLGLTFLSESWAGHIRIGSNSPYWSLCFELWYYVAFGLLVFGRRWLNVLGAVLALVIAGPKIAVLFPLWLLGVGAHVVSRRKILAPKVGLAIVLFIWTGTTLVLAWLLTGQWLPTPTPAFDFHGHSYGLDYLIGILFALTIVGVSAAHPIVGGIARRVERGATVLASTTFTLYLFHFPLIAFLRSMSPWPAASWANGGMILCGTAAMVVAIARLTELRRHRLRTMLERLLTAAGSKLAAVQSGGSAPAGERH